MSRGLSICAALVLAGCTTTADGVETISTTVEMKDIPLLAQPRVDVVLVVDNSPAMAGARERIVTELAAAAANTDLSTVDTTITVVASDGTVRGTLASRGRAELPAERSFDGDFATEIAALVDVGASGENHALDAMSATLETLAGDGRTPYVLMVLGTDDASPSPLAAHSGEIPEEGFVTAVMPAGLPRMEQFLGQFHGRSGRADFVDGFGSNILLVPERWPLVGEPCFDDAPLSTCSVSYRWATGEQIVPECVRDPLARPCWSMETAPFGQCLLPQQIHIRHANPRWFWMALDPELPSDAHLVEQCAVDR